MSSNSQNNPKLDLSKINFEKNVISTEETLKDVTPINWPEDVLSGKKKVVLSNGEIDYENKRVKVEIHEQNK